MPQKASANAAKALGLTDDGEKTDFLVIEVGAPLAGLYDLGQPFALPPEALALSTNNTFSGLALQKRPGCVQIGRALTDQNRCFYGIHMPMLFTGGSPPETRMTLVRVNGPSSAVYNRLFYCDQTPGADPLTWVWRGVVSDVENGTAADVIGNGAVNGTALLRNHMLFYADGGITNRKVWIPAVRKIVDWGSNVTPAAGTIDSEVGLGGFLLSARRYSFKYQYINTLTGFKTPLSAESNVWLTTNPGDTVLLNITVPAVAGLDAYWSILRIARSPGAVDPAVPAEWKFEKDLTGQNPSAPVVTTLTIPDGNLGADNLPDVYSRVPPVRYLLYDPAADRAIGFGSSLDPNVVYWSEAGNFGNWPPVNQTPPIDDNDGDPLTGGYVSPNGTIYLMKQRSGIYALVPSIAGGYATPKITNAAGCSSFFSVVCRGASLFWLCNEGAIEFQGQEPVNISDDRIRILLRDVGSAIVDAYVVEDRKPGSPEITWIIPGAELSLTYNTELRNWTTSDYGDASAAVQWAGRGTDSTGRAPYSERWIIYTGDTSGRCFRLGSDVNNAVVYADNGADYTWDVRTPWFGNGIDTYIPRYFDFLLGICPIGLTDGVVRVSLYTDGDETEKHHKDYILRDSTDPKNGKKLYVRRRFRMNSTYARSTMFQIGLTHVVKNGAPVVPWYRILYTMDPAPPRGEDD